jgi:sporulation protein YlmC with PRC-barrel domain
MRSTKELAQSRRVAPKQIKWRTKMIRRSLAAALLGTTLLASAAVAQPSTITPNSDASAASNSQGQWRSSKLIGVDIYNQANEKLGSIEDLIINTNGNIGSVVVGVGGFLGIGEHNVSVSFDKLTWVNEAVRTTTSSNTSSATAPTATADGASKTTTGMSTTTTTTTARTVRAADEKWYPDHAVFEATKDELKAMPEFKW